MSDEKVFVRSIDGELPSIEMHVYRSQLDTLKFFSSDDMKFFNDVLSGMGWSTVIFQDGTKAKLLQVPHGSTKEEVFAINSLLTGMAIYEASQKLPAFFANETERQRMTEIIGASAGDEIARRIMTTARLLCQILKIHRSMTIVGLSDDCWTMGFQY